MPWPKHGKICMTIGRLIGNHVEAHDLGHVMSNDSWVQTKKDPDTVRGGDICYFSYERLPKGPVPDGLLAVVPDLVVEVCSPSDRWSAILMKASECLDAGVRVFVVADLKSIGAAIYRAESPPQVYRNGEALTLPDVLPGFSVPVHRLFA